MTQQLILASTSTYKKNLLERLKISFGSISPEIEETQNYGELPKDMAQRLAESKAKAVSILNPNKLVLGTDQTGELKGKVLGKPGSFKQAAKQLAAQSGQTVYFHSAISVVKTLDNGEMSKTTKLNTTKVTFRDLSKQHIETYLKIEKPYDCAGSFKSEGLGITLFRSIDTNDPTSLIGLPLIDLCSILKEFEISIP